MLSCSYRVPRVEGQIACTFIIAQLVSLIAPLKIRTAILPDLMNNLFNGYLA